jgi:hypothetical protein
LVPFDGKIVARDGEFLAAIQGSDCARRRDDDCCDDKLALSVPMSKDAAL